MKKWAVVALAVLSLGMLTGCAFTDWVQRLLGNDILIAKYEAEQAQAAYLQAQEVRLQIEAKVDLQRAENEGMIYRANAQSITRQSRAHVALQGVMVVFACAGLIAGGLLVTVLLKERYA